MRVIWVMMMVAVIGVGCRRSTTGPGRGSGGGGDTTYYDPRNISRTDSTQSSGPTIAIGPDGTIYVTWMDGSRTGYEPFQIYFRYKPPGGDWSDIEILSDSLHNAWSPFVVADPSGNVHLVWSANTVGHNDFKIYYRMRNPSGAWSQTIVVSGDEQADQPRVAVDSSGTIHVLWNERSFKYRRRFPNGTWSEIESGSVLATNPSIAVDPAGGVHLVCEQGGGNDILYLYRSPTGEWSEPVNVSRSPNWISWIPTVAVNGDGTVWVNWVEMGQRAMYYAIKTPHGTWTIPDSVPNIPGYPATNVIAFDKFGNLYYVWEEIRGSGYNDIYYKVRTYRGDWKSDINISNTWDQSVAPDFAIGNDGIHIVWGERTETPNNQENYEIYYVFIPF